jgi:integrase
VSTEPGSIQPVTIRGYRAGLKPARDAFGHKRVQAIEPADVRAVMRARQGKAKGTNRITMHTVRSVFELAVDDGVIRVNPAAKVKATGKAATAREELTAPDAALIAAKVGGDRLEVCWLLTLAGLRRSEVVGLRWSDLTDSTVTIARGRTDVDPTVTTPPKSERSLRVLPLPAHIVAAVKRTRAARKREVLALGGKWQEAAFVAVDKAQEPLRPEVYSDEWVRLCERAKVAKPVTLHGARHGSATRMLVQGIPVHVAADWHGHDAAVMLRTYAHADEDGLRKAGEALAL